MIIGIDVGGTHADGVLLDGDRPVAKHKVSVDRRERAEHWDILVNDEQGASFRWPSLKLAEISTLVLTIKAGQTMAFYE